jgi:glycopeptide antibiotics resistance protein
MIEGRGSRRCSEEWPGRTAAGVRGGARWLILGYLIVVAYATLAPFEFVQTPEALSAKIAKIKWIPFRNPETGGLHSPRDIIRNVVLFVPFGFFGFFAHSNSRRAAKATMTVAFWGLAASLLIEGLQLLTVTRATNVTDIIANTAGSYVGARVASWSGRHVSMPSGKP